VTHPKTTSTVIIGGGFTGLTAAYRLAQAGWSRITLIERNSSLGGLAGDFALQGTHIEKTYHHLFRTDRAILDLVNELGLRDRLMWLQSSLGIFYQGRVYPFMSPRDVLAFAPCSLFNRLRLGLVALYLQKRKDWRPLCQHTAHKWMAGACGKQATQVVWEPLLRGKFHRYFDSVSMAWLWARIHTRANSRDKASAEKLGYFRGGFAVLTSKLESELVKAGVVIRKSTAVQEIKHAGGRPALLIEGKLEPFDRCIFTGPSTVFAELLPQEDAAVVAYCQRLKSIDYLGAISLVFVSGQEIGDYYWLNINQSGAPFLVFIRHTRLVDKALYGSKEVYYIGSYQPHDSPLFAMTEAEIVDLWFGFLRTIYPRFDPARVIERRLFKLKYAQHIVDTSYQSKIPDYQTPLPGVYLANFSQVFPDDRGTNFAVREGQKIAALLDGRQGAATDATDDTN
jgi:protoporphyrinogen oxidase